MIRRVCTLKFAQILPLTSSLHTQAEFNPSSILILAKHSRYEYEKCLKPELSEEQLKKHLRMKGSDYDGLLARHNIHLKQLHKLVKALETRKVDIHVVNRLNYTKERVKDADAIFTVGGDGTFLLAASAVLKADTPVIGINSDPERSEGHLCLPKEYSADLSRAMNNLFNGKFKRLRRQRIRISLLNPNTDEKEAYTNLLDITPRLPLTDRLNEHIAEHEELICERKDRYFCTPFPVKANPMPLPKATTDLDVEHNDRSIILPVRALNEVYLGENISARVSYYEMAVDEHPPQKQKSSGVTICTGTGSSSWHMHINQLSSACVQELLALAQSSCSASPTCGLSVHSKEFFNHLTHRYNASLVFDPERLIMGYSVRDPVTNGVFHVTHPKGFAKKIVVRSRMWDSHLVIDGGFSYPFNEGTIALFEIYPEDALNCVIMEN